MVKAQEFRLYNNMTKQKEIFVPKEPGKVGMYLKYLGYQVNYVRNFTDVDDKIIRRANELGEDPIALSSRYCQEFLVDMVDLQCLPPTYQPRVTDHMEEIKDMIAQIINNGCAYEMEGDVYFSVEKLPSYGQLSGRKPEDNRAGERVAIDTRKRNPADFALWKAAKPREPSWGSTWGPGRPGWHIECSAMSAHHLTYSFDIHGGGMDLIFRHHENELALSCAACPESHVKYWVHNEFVTANGEKMSKSLGNFFTIRGVTERPCKIVRMLYLDSNKAAKRELIQMEKYLRLPQAAEVCISKLCYDFEMKLSDDLNTPYILNAALQEALKFMNSSMNLLKKKRLKQPLSVVIQSLTELEKEVKKVLSTLGLLSASTYSEVLQQLKEKALKRSGLMEEDILDKIKKREVARKDQNFETSDQIRIDLAAQGIALMDVGNATIWRPMRTLFKRIWITANWEEFLGTLLLLEQATPKLKENQNQTLIFNGYILVVVEFSSGGELFLVEAVVGKSGSDKDQRWWWLFGLVLTGYLLPAGVVEQVPNQQWLMVVMSSGTGSGV
ncbi:hypothetical protein Vadar_021055 [Vaccinium darrowii]|uniref:Uncharacterized protein n=1 Tax=Vaccinium darrowii TaxID=229202 RepID=A0ACB7Y8B4_9ERIC|nr:hypothetical protein Vadar_021055 [Vaccinium darrowii]